MGLVATGLAYLSSLSKDASVRRGTKMKFANHPLAVKQIRPHYVNIFDIWAIVC
jgi:hypothetical protein